MIKNSDRWGRVWGFYTAILPIDSPRGHHPATFTLSGGMPTHRLRHPRGGWLIGGKKEDCGCLGSLQHLSLPFPEPVGLATVNWEGPFGRG